MKPSSFTHFGFISGVGDGGLIVIGGVCWPGKRRQCQKSQWVLMKMQRRRSWWMPQAEKLFQSRRKLHDNAKPKPARRVWVWIERFHHVNTETFRQEKKSAPAFTTAQLYSHRDKSQQHWKVKTWNIHTTQTTQRTGVCCGVLLHVSQSAHGFHSDVLLI